MKVELHLQPGESAIFSLQVTLTSASYSWWDDSFRVDSRVAGIDEGINVVNSGDFDDIALRGGGQRTQEFTSANWYDRGTQGGVAHGYAINSQVDIVESTAALISSDLPEGLQDKAYAYARAAFDSKHEQVT